MLPVLLPCLAARVRGAADVVGVAPLTLSKCSSLYYSNPRRILHTWEGDIPEFMSACDVEIYGTYCISSSVELIQISDDTEVTVCNLQGQVICRNIKWQEIAPRLNPGLYLVNGRKILKGD